MTLATVVYALVFGTLVAGAAAALDGLLRLGRRAARGVWVAALGITIVAAALAPVRAARRPRLAAAVAVVPAPLPRAASLADRIGQSVWMVRRLAASAVDRTLAWVPASRVLPLDRGLAAAWVIASVAVLALLLAVHAHFRTARRSWPLVTLQGTSVRLAPRTGPAVLGVAAPEIVVPTWFVARSRAEQRVVLDHEREHVRARDPLVLAAGYAAAALMPWHPGVWWMLKRLRLAVELDCDARVLRRGVTARSYGAVLIDLAGHTTTPAGVPVLGLTLTDLERRLIAMTPHRQSHPYARTGLFAAGAVLAIAVACNAPMPTTPQQTESARSALAAPATLTARFTPGDSVLIRIDGLMAQAFKSESLQFAKPGTIRLDRQVVSDLRQKLEYLITAARAGQERAQVDSALQRAKVSGQPSAVHVGYGPLDPSEAIREQKVEAAAARVHEAAKFKGLVLIDGVAASPEAMQKLSPDQIARIDVIKSTLAPHTFSDPRAANGVIKVETKKP